MRGPKRNKAQREMDLEIVASLYCEGKPLRLIAEIISSKRDYSLTHVQIDYDLKILLKRWKDSANRAIDEHMAEELAKANKLEQVYWDAWERSLKIKTITSQEVTGVKDGQGRVKKLTREEETTGDPRFLAGVQWCIERRCKLMGLDAPDKLQVSDLPMIVDDI